MIATRNRCADLRVTCRRLVELQPQPKEVLICADGCTDCSVAMIKAEFPQFRLIENEQACGSVAARHRLLTMATGDIVVSLDDDSYPVDDDFFASLPDAFAAHPEAAVITFPELRNGAISAPACEGAVFSLSSSGGEGWGEEAVSNMPSASFVESGSFIVGGPQSGHYVSAYPNCAAAIRREVYLKTGGYPSFFFHGYEEPDFALQCYAAGYAVWFEPSLPIRHHLAEANRSRFRFHQSNARNEIWSVWLRCPWPWLPLVSLFRVSRQFCYACKEGWTWALQEPRWWLAALAGVGRCWRTRRPLPWQIYFAWMQLARNPICTVTDLRAKFPTISSNAQGMNIFSKHRKETALDRKMRAVLNRAVTPRQAVVSSAVVFICCAWCFVVSFQGWPRDWARLLYALCLFAAPALGFASVRELFRSGWGVRLFLAAVLSIGGFALWCATTYLVIHPRVHAAILLFVHS